MRLSTSRKSLIHCSTILSLFGAVVLTSTVYHVTRGDQGGTVTQQEKQPKDTIEMTCLERTPIIHNGLIIFFCNYAYYITRAGYDNCVKAQIQRYCLGVGRSDTVLLKGTWFQYFFAFGWLAQFSNV